MDVNKIKEGKMYDYKTAWYKGRGRVKSLHKHANGWWITIFDKENDRSVNIRPVHIVK